MCLTEPHAGSDLRIIRNKAVPQKDGSYAITGTKIFITGGEHDLTDNIIHLVLAKLPDDALDQRGDSLFLVPKVHEDGSATPLHRNKRIIAEFYFSNLLPRIDSLEQIITNNHSSIMAMDAADF